MDMFILMDLLEWVTENNDNGLHMCQPINLLANNEFEPQGNNFISAPYICDEYFVSSTSCGDGVVVGSASSSKGHCGTFDDCYYYGGNLKCAHICVDNRFNAKSPLEYWWSA
jgi:hypothetical protein